MSKLKDGYWRQISSTVGDNNYLLKAAGDCIGLHAGRNDEPNKVVRTDGSGYIQAGWINTTSGNFTGTPARIYASDDGYIRYMTPANFFPILANSGNDISITIGGQNRTLTVGFATNSTNARKPYITQLNDEEGNYPLVLTEINSSSNYYNIYKNYNNIWWNPFLKAFGHGVGVQATGASSHAEGYYSIASGYDSHAEGCRTTASGDYSHAEGDSTIASGEHSHSEGESTKSQGGHSHSEGKNTVAGGANSHAEGFGSSATGVRAHSEGSDTIASGNRSHAEGSESRAFGYASHAEGNYTTAGVEGSGLAGDPGQCSHSEGEETVASGKNSHAEGYKSQAIGNYSHAEGENTQARGLYTHTEGFQSYAAGDYSHAEGRSSANGQYSHSEGLNSTTSARYAHAEGYHSYATGEASHAEGYEATASGNYSHSSGYNTIASHAYEAAFGKFNVSNSNTLFSVGYGNTNNDRKNLFEVKTNGNIYFNGASYYINGSYYNGTAEYANNLSNPAKYYWANLTLQTGSLDTTVPSFGAIRMNGVTSAGANYITGTAGRIYFGGNFHIDSLGSNSTYINHYTANNVYLVTGGGKVGIGTTSPSAKLHVYGDTILGSKSLYYQRSTRGTIHHEIVGDDADYGVMKIRHTSTEGSGGPGGFTASLAIFDERPNTISGTYEPTFYINRTGATRVPDLLGINVEGTRVFTVQSNGNTGIGTTSPENKLDVNGVASIYPRGNDNTAFKGNLIIKQQNSVEDSGQNFTSSNPSFGIQFNRFWTSNGAAYGETIAAGIYATVSSSWRGGLIFRTKNNQTQGGSPDTNALRLRPDGNAAFAGGIGSNGTNGNATGSYIAHPGGGVYATSTSSVTGYLKITLPQKGKNTMMSFDVTIYTYEGTNQSYTTYHISGYEYSTNGWYEPVTKVYSEGIGPYTNLTVRLGNDGTYACVTIGEANTVWSYPQVTVHNIMTGYSGCDVDTWIGGWAVGFTTTALTTVVSEKTSVNTQNINVLGSAGSVAWANITGKPINLKAYSGSLSSAGWKTLQGNNSSPSIAISYNNSAANWNSGTYSASMVWGCGDTRGLIDCAYNTPKVTFGGCSFGGATDDNPTWYFKLIGTTETEYNLDTRWALAGHDHDGRYLSKISNDSTPYQYEFTKTSDHAIKVGTIRGRAVGSQTGEFIHLYERVAIGSPNGWGSRSAPSYGLATYGGAWLATDTGSVGIGTTSPSYKLHVNGTSYLSGETWLNSSIYIIADPGISLLINSYGLRSDYTSASYPTEDYLKAWTKYAYDKAPGRSVIGYISPNSRGFIQADIYASGLITQAQIDSGGSYTGATLGLPVHITGRYYPHGGTEFYFGTSYGKWYYNTVSADGHEHNYLKHLAKSENDCIPSVYDAFQSFRCTSSTTGFGDGYIISWDWSSGNYVTQLFTDVDANYALCYRYRNSGGTWASWKRIPMADGTGASGTWDINITGSAGSVDSVAWTNITGKPASKTIWGQTYINSSGEPQNVDGLIYITANGNTTTIGSQNSTWCHIYNSADIPFIFNKSVYTIGHVYPYSDASYDLGGSSNKWRYFYLNNRAYLDEWIQFSGNTGLYFPNSGSGTHFYPANDCSYGSFQISGTKGGYYGITAGPGNTYLTLMSESTHQGLYNANQGKWVIYYNRPNNYIGIGTSSITKAVSVSGQTYISSNTWIGTTSGSEMLNIGGWVGTVGSTGWYNISYGGGIYMTDSDYVRVYNSKRFYNDNTSQYAFYTAGGITTSGFHHSSHDSNDYVLLAGGGTALKSSLGGSADDTVWQDNSNSTKYKIQVVSSLPSSTNSNTFYVIV